MSPKLAMAVLFAGTSLFARGQNSADSIRDSYHIFFPAMGKDILAARVGTHRYKIVNLYNKPAEVYVDDRKITDAEMSKYDAVLQRIKTDVRDEDEDRQMHEMERDRHQAERDERQAQRDREQAARDREQAQRDRAQQQIERTQQQRDREQVQRDREQQQRDRQRSGEDRQREQADRQHNQEDRQRDLQERQREQSERQREQAEGQSVQVQVHRVEPQVQLDVVQQRVEVRNKRMVVQGQVLTQPQFAGDFQPQYDFVQINNDRDCCGQGEWNDEGVAHQREQSAEDRAMLKKGIQALVDEHVIGDAAGCKSLLLTDTDISVNGVRQPENIYQLVRSRLGDWAQNGFSFDASGSGDSYSLSINN